MSGDTATQLELTYDELGVVAAGIATVCMECKLERFLTRAQIDKLGKLIHGPAQIMRGAADDEIALVVGQVLEKF